MRTPPSERYVPLVEALYQRTTGLWFSYGELAAAIGHGHTGRAMAQTLSYVARYHGIPNRGRLTNGEEEQRGFDDPMHLSVFGRVWNDQMVHEGLVGDRWPEHRRLSVEELRMLLADVLVELEPTAPDNGW